MAWWDNSRIETTVTRQFVISHLQRTNTENLDEALGFGDGLTDGTYWEWIETKAKRIFLILLDIGIPDQIFAAVDHSWDDDDLPFSLNDVERVTAQTDHKLNWKFWDRQFYYVLREVEGGAHVVYEDDEVVPIDIVDKRQSATAMNHNHYVDRVTLPNVPERAFCRRRFPTSNIPAGMSHEDFLKEIRSTKNICNEHIVSYFASYTHLGSVYVLLTYPGEYNLKAIVSNIPASFKALPKRERQIHILNWIHCLADSLCYLHGRNRSHGNIRPSSIALDSLHRILLADMASLSFENLDSVSEKAAFNKESYDYAAPEQWFRPASNLSLYGRTSLISTTSAFSVNRGEVDQSNIIHTTPHLDPQAADIFSLGCVILELIGLLLKRPSKSFAAHRGAKHKLAGRGGAPLDTSFHKNLGQVESWMTNLVQEANKKDELIFRGVAPILQVVARMLSVAPQDRPTARVVEQQLYRALTSHGIGEPHCVHQYEGFDLGFHDLRIRDDGVPISISTRRHSDHRLSRSGGKRPLSPRDSGLYLMSRSQPIVRDPRAANTAEWDAPVHT
ncbi:hypothetical protein TruAng_008008 [Truncatella angustata]|nr:hypothetical protein TruAng_008008 [Truncatella angustata]